MIDHENKELYILGDLNSDLWTTKQTRAKRLLMELCEIYQLKQLITEPTRITPNSSTLIDVILTNSPSGIIGSGVLHMTISDHCLIYAVLKFAVTTKTIHRIKSEEFQAI